VGHKSGSEVFGFSTRAGRCRSLTKIGPTLNADEKKKRDAQTLYIKGRNSWNKRTADGINDATRIFNEPWNSIQTTRWQCGG
jgi:hypothetical protein